MSVLTFVEPQAHNESPRSVAIPARPSAAPGSMWVGVTSRWIQKGGNDPSEYEDAFFPGGSYRTEAREFRVAVADGATESSYSGEWARLVARGYGRRWIDPTRLTETLPRVQRRWAAKVGSRQLPWYAQEKLQQGAFATLLGVTIWADSGGGRFDAVALGDSCLFLLRRGRLEISFPIRDAEHFSNHPALLSSLPNASEADRLTSRTSGRLDSGDVLLLATDALGKWLLSPDEPVSKGRRRLTAAPSSRNSRLEQLLGVMDSRIGFGALIQQLRASGEMQNDDVTAVAAEVSFRP